MNQDAAETSQATSEARDVIFNPLLAYALYAKAGGGTNDNLKNAIISKFTVAQIKDAKSALWLQSLSDVIGPLHQRRGNEDRYTGYTRGTQQA